MAGRHRQSSRSPVVEKYAGLARDYDKRWSFYLEATTRSTIARLDLAPHERLLDVGCGTGALLDRLARSHPSVRLAGVDPVPEMLAIARARLGSAVDLREGWAESLPFETEQFDRVVSCNMFHYVREPLAALLEMRRVLRPGGQLVVTDWCDDYLACRVCDFYLRLFSPAHVRMYGEKECARLVHEAGHARVDVQKYRISWLWGLMTATATKEAA